MTIIVFSVGSLLLQKRMLKLGSVYWMRLGND